MNATLANFTAFKTGTEARKLLIDDYPLFSGSAMPNTAIDSLNSFHAQIANDVVFVVQMKVTGELLRRAVQETPFVAYGGVVGAFNEAITKIAEGLSKVIDAATEQVTLLNDNILAPLIQPARDINESAIALARLRLNPVVDQIAIDEARITLSDNIGVGSGQLNDGKATASSYISVLVTMLQEGIDAATGNLNNINAAITA